MTQTQRKRGSLAPAATGFALAVALLAGFAAGTPARAQDAALYDAAPPPNSAFVRFIDARGQGNLQVGIGEKSVTVPATAVSPYVVVPAGEQDLNLSTNSGKVAVAAGKYYTVALFVDGATTPTLIEDPVLDNPAKSGVYLYNFSDVGPIKLYAPKPKVAVIDNVAKGASGFKVVNAVTVDFEVVNGDKPLASLGALALKRRSSTSVVVTGKGDAAKAVAVENTTQP